jgi:uroporphyrin-III C-methyltransferase
MAEPDAEQTAELDADQTADSAVDPTGAPAEAAPDTDPTGSDTDATSAEGMGMVYLVGSGPGDPELLTVKAKRLLERSDVVLHDKLPGPTILGGIAADKREDVGKRATGEWTSQEYTNRRLVELAEAGNTVVRLKGGDPFVFGRGGEEMQHLAANGVPFEVVPGITSAVAGAGVAGIPVTHREHVSSVSFVTGHEDPTKAESAVDWEALAATGGTLVVLMGVGKLPLYTEVLLEAGMDPETPVALVERATWPDMQVATGTLESIVSVRDREGITPPALTVIGEVAGVRDDVVAFLRNRADHALGRADTAADAVGDDVAAAGDEVAADEETR